MHVIEWTSSLEDIHHPALRSGGSAGVPAGGDSTTPRPAGRPVLLWIPADVGMTTGGMPVPPEIVSGSGPATTVYRIRARPFLELKRL